MPTISPTTAIQLLGAILDGVEVLRSSMDPFAVFPH